jgi:hypothetical protein
MSCIECQLFQNTESDTGKNIYFFGNFALHYMPLLVAVMLTGLTKTGILTKDLDRDIVDILSAAGYFFIYVGLYNPCDVYACTWSKQWIIYGVMLVIVCMCSLRWVLHIKLFNFQ